MNGEAGWIVAVVPCVVTLGVVLAPGLLALAPARLPLVARIALAGPLSIALLGISGVVGGLAGAPLAVWQPFLLAGILALAVWLSRGRVTPLALPQEAVRWWWLALGWIGAAAVIAVVTYSAVPSPDRISQTYDNVFHLSAVAHIVSTGDASSLTLRTIIETDHTWSFYPAAWHSIVALVVQATGASIAVSVNAAWLSVCAAIWVPGAVWLAQTVLREFEPGTVALVAVPLTAAFASMPYALLTWGTLYPTFLATALLPAAVAFPIAVWDGWRTGGLRAARPLVAAAAGVTMTLLAVALAQPRVMVSWLVIVVPYFGMRAWSAYRAAVRTPGKSRVVARASAATALALSLVAMALLAWYAISRLGLFERPLDDRLAGPQAKASQSLLEGVLQVFTQSWPLGVGQTVTFPALLVAVAVIGGVAVAARTRNLRWLVVSYALLCVAFIFAAGSDDILTKLATAAWYKDRYRISSVLPVLGVSLATLGVLALARWWKARGGALRLHPPLLSWVAALSAAFCMMLGVSAAVGTIFRMPDTAATSEVVSRAQIEFFREAARVVPEGQRVLGDPWDGSALSQVFGGREPVFPHVNGQWDPARVTVAWSLPDIETDPAVCAALDELRVRYVLYNPHSFGGGDPSGNHFPGPHAAVEADLFTPILTDGDSTLYRIDQCGPLPGL